MLASPIVVGIFLAIVAAAAFGATAPLIQRFGAGVGPFTTAALLYAGAVFGALPWTSARSVRREAGLRASHVPRLLLISFFGAALAPVLFAWGLQRVAGTYGALLLTAEAVFTIALAALIHREHIGRRVAIAALLILAGGVASVAGASTGGPFALAGALAVVGAVFCWALDNVLTRPFADFDPAAVVRVKALVGVVMTSAMALAWKEAWPAAASVAGLVACGATGYGASLRLYLLAQRRIGAARTGSVFAVAPFVGAVVAVLLGDDSFGPLTAVAAVLFLAGVVLHATEAHGHLHTHDALEHDHAHSHDDGHHDHHHDVAPAGAHAHWHWHEPQTHDHPHGPDAHHTHRH